MAILDDFIRSELAYFEPILERQRLSTQEMREKWRKETVAERLERVSLETYDMCDGRIKYGPFIGLKLNKDAWWGRCDLGSQCLGLYERDVLDLIVDNGGYDHFIDIGAADGYYAIGMLFSGLAKKAICFEISKQGQTAIQQNWITNDSIGELEVYGEANTSSIKKLPEDALKKTLVLIDIEGFEFYLLQKEVISRFQSCEIIIEIHNWVDDFEKKYTKLLKDLSNFFYIRPVANSNRDTVNIKELRSYTDDNRLLLTSERRPCLMRFLHLTPLAHAKP